MNESNGGASRKPLSVLAVIEKKDAPTRWMKVGAAFPNRDGSVTLYLDAFPTGTNKLQVREERDWGRAGAGGNGFSTPAPAFDGSASGAEAES